jgi:hypothetical protein
VLSGVAELIAVELGSVVGSTVFSSRIAEAAVAVTITPVGVCATAVSAGLAGVDAARRENPQAIMTIIANTTHKTLNRLVFIPKSIAGLHPTSAFLSSLYSRIKFPR